MNPVRNLLSKIIAKREWRIATPYFGAQRFAPQGEHLFSARTARNSSGQISNGVKVLMPVLHYYPVIGGLENWTQNIAERLSDKAEIFIVTGKVGKQPKREIKNRVYPVKSSEAGAKQFNGVKILRTSLFALKNLSYSSPIYILTALTFIFFRSLALIKNEKINLLHCQGFLSSFLGYLLFRITKIPYLVTVQRLEESRGFLRKLVYRNAKVCIAASSAIRQYFEEIGAKNIEIIPNGIDLEKFKNLEPKPHQGFVVVTIARLEKVKGVEYLIKAAKNFQLQPSGESPLGPTIFNFQLVIIGDGSERKNLENLAKELGLEETVKFLGQVPNEKIPEYLSGADCFVLPSLREGFGIAILEALAAGLPVIGTDVGGIRDIIENGKTGILVEPGSSRAITKAIDKVYSGQKFAQVDLEKYNWQNIALRVFQIYEDYFSCRNIPS